jgi:hypothetical protein
MSMTALGLQGPGAPLSVELLGLVAEAKPFMIPTIRTAVPNTVLEAHHAMPTKVVGAGSMK